MEVLWDWAFTAISWIRSGMKYTNRYFLRALLVALILGLPALAQSNYPAAGNFSAPPASSFVASTENAAGDSDDSVLTIKKRVNEVNLLFIATDKHGKFVRNLSEDDFAILDDHKPPQSIVNFRSETDLPLELGLLIDTSGSVRTRFDFEQESAIDFLQQTLRPNFDKAFVMGFNSHSTVTQDFTDDNVLLRVGVHRLQNGGGTALYDAIYRACKNKLMKEQEDRPVRRAIIVVSDGEDNQSEVSEAQAIEMAQRAQVIIYAISTDDSGLILRGDTVLQQLADASGGRAFFPFKMKDIKGSFSAIEDELRSQYIISYHPADFEADGRYRPIEISALKKDLQVRARKGYYAPKQ
ncbi:MAG: VWA domain-containing protein [Acidobacteriaceae bacterium]|nr:VWA domain-containing protein [Acidobacteriaceae bacterium]